MAQVDGPIQLFPTLYRIEDFICRDHPVHHPSTREYEQYWLDQEKKCLEGLWGYDSDGTNGGWRYMPGNLYYYVNLCQIILEEDGANKITYPMLRDVEWMLSYGWLAARRFSGFEDDEEYTCHRIVDRIEREGIDALTPKEKKRITHLKSIYKPDGTFKKYKNAIDYLYETKSKPLGQPLYKNQAKNFFVLGSRGFGKSFYCGNAVIGHEYNFFGKNKYDNRYLVNPSPSEVFVGSALASKSSELLSKFEITQEYLKSTIGAWKTEDEFIPGYFYNHSKGTLMPNNAHNPYRHRYEIKEGGIWRRKGTGSKIVHGVYTTENPQAAVGNRPTVMVIEEVGLLGNLLTVHGANETCQIRDTKFGSSFYIGTGGNMEKITESKIVFNDAEAYEFIGYRDVFEGRAKKIGFFLPAYYVDNTFKDPLGNTDLQAAYDQEIHERELRKKASTAAALTEYVLSRPIVPSEMFLSSQNIFFPVAQLKEQYVCISREEPTKSIGEFEWINKSKREVKWRPNYNRRPIEELYIKPGQDESGAWIIYEHPPDMKPLFRLKNPLYRIVYDPVKDDEGGRSLASVLVYKGHVSQEWWEEKDALQDEIVAEYIGRLDRVEDIHEMVIQAAIYFGARVLVENNLPDFIRYCRIRGMYHILQPSPWEAISKIIKNPTRKYDVGVTMNKGLNVQTEQLIANKMQEEWQIKEDDKLLWLNKIKSKRLLLEAINYNREGNFDHISSMKLLALWLSNDIEQKVQSPENEVDYRKKWDKWADTLERHKKDPYYYVH